MSVLSGSNLEKTCKTFFSLGTKQTVLNTGVCIKRESLKPGLTVLYFYSCGTDEWTIISDTTETAVNRNLISAVLFFNVNRIV